MPVVAPWRGLAIKSRESAAATAKQSRELAFAVGEAGANFASKFESEAATINSQLSWSAAKSAPYKRNTMSVSATVVGFEPEEGDRLVAYADHDEVVGNGVLRMDDDGFAAADGKPVFYLSIAGDTQQTIRFAIERDGEIVASSDMQMDFQANAVVGSPDEPTAINFMQAPEEDGKWYTIGGVLLPQKPTQKGLYIHNGKKVVIK